MHKDSLYSPELWSRFCEKICNPFELKTYSHLDPHFNFPDNKEKLHQLISDPSLESVSKHHFLPFIKILTKTPRYRWQESDQEYSLDTKIRPIAFASHFDSYIYAFYSFTLTERYQKYIQDQNFSECVLAYRTDLRGECNIQFAKKVFDSVKNKMNQRGSCSVIALDITGYFDNIDHKILREKWLKVIDLPDLPIDQYKIYRSLTQYTYISKNSILRHFKVDLKNLKKVKSSWHTLLDLIPAKLAGPKFLDKMKLLRANKLVVTNLPKKSAKGTQYRGIPQGSSMSALLSNIYLIDFDKWLWDLSIKMDFTYRRYCDDLIVVCNSDKTNEINQNILNKISEYHLKIQDKKTEVIEFTKNSKGKFRAFDRKAIEQNGIILRPSNEQKYYKSLQYLGFEFNGQNIYIRPGSLSRYFQKMKRRIIKTIMMSYSDKSKVGKIKKRQIYFRYSHFGPRNFITYAKNSSKEHYKTNDGDSKVGMGSRSISRQISAHAKLIEIEIRKKSVTRFEYKKFIREQKISTGKKQKLFHLKR
jgi:RNA-directed DNA polymerase